MMPERPPPTPQAVGQGDRLGGAGGVLVYGDQARQAEAHLVLVAQRVAGAFRRRQRHVHILPGADEIIVDVEAVAEHDVLAGAQVRLDLVGKQHGLLLVRNKDHQHVGPFRRFGHGDHIESGRFGLLARGRAFLQRDLDVLHAGILEVQRMGMTLAAIADDRDLLLLDREMSASCS